MIIYSLKAALQAQKLNSEIFETIYYHALKSSSELSVKEGPYETYAGSPVSKVGTMNFGFNDLGLHCFGIL